MELRTDRVRSRGHPTPRLSFVDVATGSLGQGICAAVGIALNARRIGSDYRTYVLLGDGEIAEGSVWEAGERRAALQARQPLRDRRRQRPGPEPAHRVPPRLDESRRWNAFGWNAIVVDGHDIADIQQALATARATSGQPDDDRGPHDQGQGLSAIEGKDGWHGKAFKKR